MNNDNIINNNIVEVTFVEELRPIRVSDLSNFLYYLKIIYTWLTTSDMFQEYREGRSYEEIEHIADNIVQRVLQEKLSLTAYDRYNLFKKDLKGKDLFVAKIHKESPLTIWFICGELILLSVALVISGGELEISTQPLRIKIKINSLGEGIKSLRDAWKK